MNTDLLGLISSFSLTSRKVRASDSDYVDIINHHFLPLIFCFFSIIICTKQYLVGDPIQCWVNKEFSNGWEQYAENYCWVENTYFKRPNETLTRTPKSVIYYYQWVPFVLILQGFLFYLPHYFWRMTNWMSGVDINHMMHAALNTATSNAKARKENIDKLINNFQESFMEYHGNKFIIKNNIFLCCCYTITKFFYVINLIFQFVITSKFLSVNYLYFGIKVIHQMNKNIFWDTTGLFPRVSYCHFEIRTVDETHHHTTQCVLVVNMIIEKCYIFIWFILVAVLIITVLNCLQWLIWVFSNRFSTPEIQNMKIWKDMNMDSLFVLRLLKKNCLGINYNTFINEFVEKTAVLDSSFEMTKML